MTGSVDHRTNRAPTFGAPLSAREPNHTAAIRDIGEAVLRVRAARQNLGYAVTGDLNPGLAIEQARRLLTDALDYLGAP